MALFDVPKRPGKTADLKAAKKSKTPSKSAGVIKSGNSVLAKISNIKAMVEKQLGHVRNRYIVIDSSPKLQEYLGNCIRNGIISIDTETTGLDPLVDKIVGLCLYTPNQPAAYVPINHVSYVTGARVEGQLTENQVSVELKKYLTEKPKIIMHNAKFDIRVIRNQLKVPEIYCDWDCLLAARLLNENEPTNKLKKLHQKYVLKDAEDEFSFDEFFKGVSFDKIPINTGYLYAAHDAEITYELYEFQKQYLNPDSERKDMRDVYWVFKNIEMPCVPVVCDMEDNGIEFDMNYQSALSTKYNKLLKEKEEEFYKACKSYDKEIEAYKTTHLNHKLDNPINIGSPTQIAVLLYDIIGVESVDSKSPRGTGENVLEKIDNPICKSILEYREMFKLVSTYIDKLPECVNPNDGRIHCSFNQYGAKTGRFSSSAPNLQNIPSHNKDIRKMFKASDGYVLMSSDYSQQEPKVMTQMCGDQKMIDAYKKGKDLYAEIASLAFNKPYEDCLEFRSDGSTNSEGKERRSSAKSILLGILYGRGINSIAEQLHTSKQKAQQIQDKVFKGFPAIPKFEADSKRMAAELGYVTTLWGRKRRLPDISLEEFEFSWKDGSPPTDDVLDFDSEFEETDVPEYIKNRFRRKLSNCYYTEKRKIINEALSEGIKITDNGGKIADAERQVVNSRIQGSAADMSKLAMIKVGNDKKLKELGFRLLIPVHDELIGECPMENAKECSERFAELMSQAAAGKLEIPIKCDVEITKCWYGEKVVI